MEKFNSIQELTSFAHRLFSGEKTATNFIASVNGWRDLAKCTGITLIMSVLSECTDTYTLILVSKIVLQAHSALFHCAEELDKFMSSVCSLLVNNYESWSNSASASVRGMISCLTCDLYGRLPFLSSLPGILCSTIISAFQSSRSLAALPDVANKHQMTNSSDINGELQSSTVLSPLAKPSLDLLCDILMRMEEEDQNNGYDRDYSSYGDGMIEKEGNNVWVRLPLARLKFEAEHLKTIQNTVVDIIQRHILQASSSVVGAVLRLFLALLRMYSYDLSENGEELEDDDNDDKFRYSVIRRGVCPPSFLKLFWDMSLFQKLWNLQRSFIDGGSANSLASRTLHSVLSSMMYLPRLQAVGGTPTHSKEHRHQWLSLSLLQTGLLTQRLLRLTSISTSSSVPPQSCSSSIVTNEDVLVRMSGFFVLIKELYSLEEMQIIQGPYSLWLQSLADLSEWIVSRYYTSSNNASSLLVSLLNLFKVWERLACAMEFRAEEARKDGGTESRTRMIGQTNRGESEKCSVPSVLAQDCELGQRLDRLLEYSMHTISKSSTSFIFFGSTMHSLDECIDSFVPWVNIICICNKCAWWKQKMWDELIANETTLALFSSSSLVETDDAKAVIQQIIYQVLMQTAALRLLLVGDNSNATRDPNAESICSMWFQTLSLFQRLYSPIDSILKTTFSKEVDDLLKDVLSRTILTFLRLLAQWLSKDVRQQWKKNSLSKLLNERFKTEDDGKITRTSSCFSEDPALGVIVSLALTVIDHCLKLPPSGEGDDNRPMHSEAKIMAILFLEEMVASPRLVRLVHFLLSSNASGMLAENRTKSVGMWLYNGLNGKQINSIQLYSIPYRFRYAKCVAKFFQFPQVKPSMPDQIKGITISLTTLLCQLQDRLQEFFFTSGIKGESSAILLSDCRGVLNCCSTPENYIMFLDTIEPFAESILELTIPLLSSLSDSSMVIGREDTLEALRLFAELSKNRDRRLCLEQHSIRAVLLIRFMKTVVCRLKDILFSIKTIPSTVSVDDPTNVKCVDKFQDWCWEATSITFHLTLNIMTGQYCNFGLFVLYQDHALPDLLRATWSILCRLTLQDCLEREGEIGEPAVLVFREVVSDCFFDWFWMDSSQEGLIHWVHVLEELAFGPDVLLLSRSGNDIILSSSRLSEYALSVLILLVTTYHRPHSSFPQKTPRWKELPALLRRSDPDLPERLFSRSIDVLFRVTVYSSPTTLSSILSASTFRSATSLFEGISESAYLLIQLCAQLLVQIVKIDEINDDKLINSMLPNPLPGEKIELLRKAISSFHEHVSSLSQTNQNDCRSPLSAANTHFNSSAGPIIYQFLTSLNHIFHYF